jgi:hypothetical protein
LRWLDRRPWGHNILHWYGLAGWHGNARLWRACWWQLAKTGSQLLGGIGSLARCWLTWIHMLSIIPPNAS